MGFLYQSEEDEYQALHFYQESYRYNPSKIDVISWLGIHNVKNEVYEKAVEFFERAAQIQPKEVKWRLMVASCYRRMNLFQQALDMYEAIHRDHPDNIECLRYLVTICKDLGKKEYYEYSKMLKQIEMRYGGMNQQYQNPTYDAGPQQNQMPANFEPPPQPQQRFIQQNEDDNDWGEDVEELLPS